jgi:hypothetical protein
MIKLFLLSVFLFIAIFSYSVILEELLLSRKCNDIPFTEIIQGLLEDDLNKSVHRKSQKAETNSTLLIVNFILPTSIYSYQSETAGHIQPKKAILRI